MKLILTTTFALILSLSSQAQYRYTSVFSNDSGQALLNRLINTYKPNNVATYNRAKDRMFSTIYEENDTVECVYTGMKRYLNPSLDPSVAMYNNADPVNSMDTEHTYPQSKGASGRGRGDLHHMFPTRAKANNARGSIKFGVTNDANVNKWYLGTRVLTTPPALADRYLYSELINTTMFEPRDEHKGNVARAMFYFYTMYKADADAADPNYFSSQVNDLCQWHLDDPVDSMEWIRTYRIAQYQDNKVNPFVLDCTLAQRTYCTGISCTPLATETVERTDKIIALNNAPNPFQKITTIRYQLQQSQNVSLEVFDNLGQRVAVLVHQTQEAGEHQVDFDATDLPSSVYFYKITIENDGKSSTLTKAMILIE